MSRIEAQLRKNCEILHALKNSLSQSHCTFHHATRDTAAAADVFDQEHGQQQQHHRSAHLDFDFSASDVLGASQPQQFAKHHPSSAHSGAQMHDTNTNASNRLSRGGMDMLGRGPKLFSSASADTDGSGSTAANTLFAPIPVVPSPGTSAHVPPSISSSFRNYTPYSEASAMSSSSAGSGLSLPNRGGFNRRESETSVDRRGSQILNDRRGSDVLADRRGSATIAELVSRQIKGTGGNNSSSSSSGGSGAQSAAQSSSSVRTPRVAPPPHPSPPTLYSLMAMNTQPGASTNSQNSGFLKSF